jgi:hypothetical protein
MSVVEENIQGRFNIILCELYNQNLHGITETSDETINTHYLVIGRFGAFDASGGLEPEIETGNELTYISNNNSESDIYSMAKLYNNRYHILCRRYKHKLVHSVIRNYKRIISRRDYIKPEIAECIFLKDSECVAILKTFWIRIIQRTWKRVYAERKYIISQRVCIRELKYKELNGRWSCGLRQYPTLKGMMCR